MKLNLKIFVPLCLLYLFILWSYVTFNPSGLFNSTLYLFFPVIAVFAGFRLSRLYAKSVTGRIIAGMSFGLLCWALGEFIWYAFEIFLSIDPFPSVADIFYLLGYLFFVYALMKELTKIKESFKEIHFFHCVTYLIVVSFFIIPVSYYGIYSVYDGDVTMLQNIIAMAYGVGDLLLIVAASLVLLPLLQHSDGKFARFWNTMTAGFIFFLLADILFGIFTEQYIGDIKIYRYIDFLWIAGYFCFAYGLFSNHSHILNTRVKLKKLMK